MPLMFGKRPPKFHPSTLLFSKYLLSDAAPLPTAPPVKGWEYAVPDDVWAASMLGNDSVGDCAEACALHKIMGDSANNGAPITFTTQDALDLYSAITDYDPNDPSTDQGTAYTDLFDYWQKTGIKGDKILAWASVNFNNPAELNAAIFYFGAALVGIQVTQGMMDQFNAGQPWNGPFSGSTLGGHAVPIFGFGSQGRTVITWAKRQQTDLTFPSIMDECYVVISQSWLNAQGAAPSGLDLTALESDISQLVA
jgi:hypothetical protein